MYKSDSENKKSMIRNKKWTLKQDIYNKKFRDWPFLGISYLTFGVYASSQKGSAICKSVI